MAEIRLDREDADGGLPDICMSCGEEATVTKTKKMSWCPPWVGFLILVAWPVWLVVMLVLTKRATLQAPMCDQHKSHWFNRILLVAGSFFLFAFIGVAGFVLVSALQPQGGDLGLVAGLGAVGLFVAWIIVLVIAQNTAIRPKEITDSHIVLLGVSSEFVDAYEELDRERRARRRKRRQQREEEDEDEEEEEPRPRKKSAPSDAIQEKKRLPKPDEFEDQPRPRKKRPPVEDDD